MNKIIVIIIICVIGWHGNYKFGRHSQERQSAISEAAIAFKENSKIEAALSSSQFKCDGRTYCSQMTSCQEATYFIQHCPDTKMDGDKDGVPCEKQWCSN